LKSGEKVTGKTDFIFSFDGR